jgi:hypothetical protein
MLASPRCSATSPARLRQASSRTPATAPPSTASRWLTPTAAARPARSTLATPETPTSPWCLSLRPSLPTRLSTSWAPQATQCATTTPAQPHILALAMA